MRELLRGAGTVGRGGALLRAHPELRRLALVPILLNLVVAAILYVGLLLVVRRILDGVITDQGALGAALAAVVFVLVALLGLVVVGFLLVRVGVVLGSPWYGRLSEEVERIVTGSAPPAEPFTLAGLARDLGRAIAFELRKLAIVLPLALLLLLVQLLPVAGQAVGIVGGFLLTAFVACLDFFDGPQERRRAAFGSKLRFVRASAPGSAGFGLVCAALLAVPVLNLVWIPVCVAAGTVFWAERQPPATEVVPQRPSA